MTSFVVVAAAVEVIINFSIALRKPCLLINLASIASKTFRGDSNLIRRLIAPIRPDYVRVPKFFVVAVGFVGIAY